MFYIWIYCTVDTIYICWPIECHLICIMYYILSEQNNQFSNHVHDFRWLGGHPILSQSLEFHSVLMTLTAYYHIFESKWMEEKIVSIGQVIYVRDWHLITTRLTFWLLLLVHLFCLVIVYHRSGASISLDHKMGVQTLYICWPLILWSRVLNPNHEP